MDQLDLPLPLVILVSFLILLFSIYYLTTNRSSSTTSPSSSPSTSSSSSSETSSSLPLALSKDDFRPIKLLSKEQLSHDVYLFRFELPTNTILGLPIGQHISFKYIDNDGKDIIRSYTPTNADDTQGHIDFCIKIYYKNIHPKFPNGGKMSQYLNNLNLGDTILMRGPKGNITYHDNGRITIMKMGKLHEIQPKNIGLIAGGTGITPMLQLLNKIIHSNTSNNIKNISLLFANQTENDIFLKSYLENYPHDRVHIWYTIDKALEPEKWKYSIGFINSTMIREHLPPPSDDTVIFVCGPPPMIKFACEPAFAEIGYDEDHWFSF